LTVHEQGVMERTVIVEWDSYDQAVAAYQSELYQKTKPGFDKVEEGSPRQALCWLHEHNLDLVKHTTMVRDLY
jgi:hypothetical protein